MGKGRGDGLNEMADSGHDRLHSECGSATLVLDRQLHISSFTPSIQAYMPLGPADTGRPLADVPQKITDHELIPDCQKVLSQATSVTKELHPATDTYLQRCCLPCHATIASPCGVIVNYVDFSACTRTLKAMKDNQEYLRTILDTAVDGIIGIDAYGIIHTFNPAAERLFGYQASEVLGSNIKALMPAPYCEHHDAYLARYRETGEPHIIGVGREVSALRKDGSEFPIDLSISEVDHLKHYMGFIRDLSPRRALEKELLSISERAQRELGQNLHDDIGQEMTALALKADTLQELLARSGQREEAALTEKLVTGLQRTRSKIRTLAHGLIPVPIDAKGLAVALRELASEVSVTHDIICIFTSEASVSVTDPSVATHLYRIAQEAVNNAIRHGKARHIHVSLYMQDNDLYLEITDDGGGITGNIVEKPGMGLKIMQHRCGIIGGVLMVGPGKRHGTQVACRLPMSGGNP